MGDDAMSGVVCQGQLFEHQHVQGVYNRIAPCMIQIEHKAWPNVKRFLKKFPSGALVADIGCGNGRYLGVNTGVYKTGIDVCQQLVDDAKLKGYEVSYADNLHIPYRTGCFDGVLSIGVIHHFCSFQRRVAALQELSRILRPGGRLMLYVWAFEQKIRKFDSQDVLIPWKEGSRLDQRLGSTSSTQSSAGGVSNTGSVSDEEAGLDNGVGPDITIEKATQLTLRRGSSISLDDLTSARDLSEFRPSYYSLDFNSCGPREVVKKEKNDKLVWDTRHSNNFKASQKNTLIQECRKLEASLRAMSSGNLDILKKSDKDLRVELNNKSGCHSLENFEHAKTELVDCNAGLEINLHWNIGEVDDDFEKAIPGAEDIILDSGYSEYTIEDVEIGNRDFYQSVEMGHQERKSIPKSPQVNPFMKQDSSDRYAFNNVVDYQSDESESIEVLCEQVEELNCPDTISVGFKPGPKQESDGKSFLTTVKTKLLKLFDKNTTSQHSNKNGSRNMSVPAQTKQRDHLYGPSSFKLTREQLTLAEQLQFQVREFPLSSCPEVVNNHFLARNTNSNKFLPNNQNPKTLPDNAKDLNVFHRLSLDFPANTLNTGECPSDYVEIYDFFIKLNVNGDDFISSDDCALVSAEYSSDMPGGLNSYESKRSEECDSVCDQEKGQSESDEFENHNVTFSGKSNEKKQKVSDASDLSGQDPIISDVNDDDTEEFSSKESGKLCRYYHVFKEGELEMLISKYVPHLHVVESIYDHGNWCLVAEKKQLVV
ncbi:uncharacterized protein LOC127858938 [Dreissena polymorpha]|uniref:Methyltransferase type 11 domain-containing protein n=1 Tax=Dreissena polymorpha TaxID=45954 RepID=A0A9D4BYY8_DREPO|nr:uncharacterized protein LOC127858938 [Dreissena polymorpha]XP_052252265.1 uncharacterized protein LOC127858938 [Dreissena polymorpha]KAH3713524.1 hypothetical protein DPMN_073316 [Dreissena polymorpha]